MSWHLSPLSSISKQNLVDWSVLVWPCPWSTSLETLYILFQRLLFFPENLTTMWRAVSWKIAYISLTGKKLCCALTQPKYTKMFCRKKKKNQFELWKQICVSNKHQFASMYKMKVHCSCPKKKRLDSGWRRWSDMQGTHFLEEFSFGVFSSSWYGLMIILCWNSS